MRDQIMDEYIKKKRLKKNLRNDYEDEDEFEDYVVDLASDRKANKKYGFKHVIGGIFGLMFLFIVFNRRKKNLGNGTAVGSKNKAQKDLDVPLDDKNNKKLSRSREESVVSKKKK